MSCRDKETRLTSALRGGFAHYPSRISLSRKGCRVGLRITLFEMLWGGGEELHTSSLM
jgi:hypothetical protein